MIQAMVWASVPMSGAGMSVFGPMTARSSSVNRRVSRSFSSSESALGSTTTPPLAPPNGRSTTAHFQVIHIERPIHSSRVTPGWKRSPPLWGPRTLLCWAR
jgi:hypothetical protein